MIVTVLLFLVLLATLIFLSRRRPKNFPPGPAWLPIVGNSLHVKQLSKKCGGFHLALLELSKRYQTNVLGLKLGGQLVVTVFSYPVVKNVLSSEDYDPRPTNFFIKLRCLGSIRGVTCTSGETWNVQRSFAVKTLRVLGLGKRENEQQIQQQARDIVSDIENNREIEVGKLVAPAVISVLWSVVTGSRHLSKKDERLNKLLALFQSRAKFFDMSGGLLAQYPWMRFIAPEWTGYSLIKRINNELKDFFAETIREHHLTWTKKTENADLIYSFISEMKKENSHYSFTDEQLLMVCLDLFIAGAQTTSSTLDFAFLMMLQHPDIQQKVQKYLDDNCEKNRTVNYSDRLKLPYIEAVLMEVSRYRTVTPLIGPRRVVKDLVLEEYVIPKGTTVLIHLQSVHMDSVHWKDPDTFRPERFLASDGGLIYCDELIPFGLGRRRCIGDSLAKMCIFIFFTEILRHYSITRNAGSDADSEPLPGLTLSAEYAARFVRRDEED